MPITLKLIIATAVLIAAVVGAATIYSQRTINALAEENAAERRADGTQRIRDEATAVARTAALSAALPLADGYTPYVVALVTNFVEEDDRIEWMLLVDSHTGRTVKRSELAPEKVDLDDELSRELAAAPADAVVSREAVDHASRLEFAANVIAAQQVIGQVRLAVSTERLEGELESVITEGRERARDASRKLLWVGGVILLLGLLLAGFEGYRMTKPLTLLAEQAAEIAGGRFDRRVPRRRKRDEIGLLSENFNDMAERIGELMRETARTASMEHELELARQIQLAMLPSAEVIEHGRMRVLGYLQTADVCGGDWWTIRALAGEHVLVAIGDVTGHGMPSAMIVAEARGAVQSLIPSETRTLTPTEVLEAIDRAVSNEYDQDRCMTCFAVAFDPIEARIEFANAGHNFPYVRRRGSGKLDSLIATGNPLGDLEHQNIGSGHVEMTSGDIVLMYTDGLTEQRNAGGIPFGERRLRKVVLGVDSGAEDALVATRDAILSALEEFGAGGPVDDDLTFVLCEYS